MSDLMPRVHGTLYFPSYETLVDALPVLGNDEDVEWISAGTDILDIAAENLREALHLIGSVSSENAQAGDSHFGTIAVTGVLSEWGRWREDIIHAVLDGLALIGVQGYVEFATDAHRSITTLYPEGARIATAPIHTSAVFRAWESQRWSGRETVTASNGREVVIEKPTEDELRDELSLLRHRLSVLDSLPSREELEGLIRQVALLLNEE